MNKVIIIGVPRSGSSWVADVLGRAPGTISVHEPDNERIFPFALRAKSSLGRVPALRADQSAPEYEQLWSSALEGKVVESVAQRSLRFALQRTRRQAITDSFIHGKKTPWTNAISGLARPPRQGPTAENVVVKSVYAALAIDWLKARFNPRLVLVLRQPEEVVASWIDMRFAPDGLERHLDELTPWSPPPSETTRVARVMWEVALLTKAILMAGAMHTDAIVVRHEDACVDPVAFFRDLYGRTGLEWTPQTEEHVRASSTTPGKGYETTRVSMLERGKWRKRITEEQQRELVSALARWQLDYPR